MGSVLQTAGPHRDDLATDATVGQVVHDYGDVCQAITELAVAQGIAISTQEFPSRARR